MIKNPTASARYTGDEGSTTGSGRPPLEQGMATHCSILAWRIPWTEEAGRLQSIGSQRVGHDRSDLAGTHVMLSAEVWVGDDTQCS